MCYMALEILAPKKKVVKHIKADDYEFATDVKNGYRLEVTYGLEWLRGNKEPYFTITGEGWHATKDGERDKRYSDMEFGGACHDTILKAFPDMKDLVDLHLSNQNGVPMHAVENGWFFMQHPEKFSTSVLAGHLRVTEDEVKHLSETCKTKEDFAKVVEEMKPRWKSEARDVMKKYGISMPRNPNIVVDLTPKSSDKAREGNSR